MEKNKNKRYAVVDGLIYGRVVPMIYAFETNTVPNYLKVGDTYRPVKIRLDEWRRHYRDLVKKFEGEAIVNDTVYFRDHAVHKYLEDNNMPAIKEHGYVSGTYISEEFFQGAKAENVEQAIDDIRRRYSEQSSHYQYYNLEDRMPVIVNYERDADWKPRDNQKEVIDRFKESIKNGRDNLLMYAVMRFGKSFTALCCAKEMGARLVVVVCGKVDVKEEWKKNVQKPLIFDGYEFITADNLKTEDNAISKRLKAGNTVVLFLSLQDLSGEKIKEKHKELFSLSDEGTIDVLIVDETHFAARAEKTGAAIVSPKSKEEIKNIIGDDDSDNNISLEKLQESIKVIKRKVTLHLSGTPYRVIMNNEFADRRDIISFVQYSDILKSRDEWDEKHPDADEWDNPYYGFPQMIRFAFNLNEKSRKSLEKLRQDGQGEYGLNSLFKPQSTAKSNKGHRSFIYEEEILELLRAIDGTEEEKNIFSFLNYDKIQKGQMCRHMVMVLPFRASCDAMAKLLKSHVFNKLNEYEVLNISGFDGRKMFKDTAKLVKAIKDCERKGKKTITLTVCKMLTGNTVEEWDTMIYLRNGSSAEAYDQAIFRLQSSYLQEIPGPDGSKIVRNLKPQTILVDFDPDRMFEMQHRAVLYRNELLSEKGSNAVEQDIEHILRDSPILRVSEDNIVQVTATNIVDEIRKYSSEKSILDEALDLPH